MNKDELLVAWDKSKQQLETAKAEEKKLRDQVVEAFFGKVLLREGTENVDLGNDYKLKAVFKLNRNFVGGEEAVEKALQKIEKAGSEGQFIATRLVKWKPELSISEYRKLPDKFTKIIDEIITTSESTTSIEIVVPKA
jgi:hypothetical protein